MADTALIEGRDFREACGALAALGSETVFAYCSFDGFDLEGRTIEGALIGCSFERIDWYWGFFNAALIAQTRFANCVFRGCSFRGVDFVECRFENCRFVEDNVGGRCVFDNCRLTECSFDRCEIVVETRPGREPTFSKTRFYGCAQTHSRGFEYPFESSLKAAKSAKGIL